MFIIIILVSLHAIYRNVLIVWMRRRQCVSAAVCSGHGGGWGYSAHSVEAIRFCADADILLGGLGLFGGRGEYTAKIKVS